MIAVIYLVFVAGVAGGLQSRLRLLDAFRGVPRYLLSLGLALFLVAWADLLIYALCGWGPVYRVATWAVVLAPAFFWARGLFEAATSREKWILLGTGLTAWRRWNYGFLFLAGLVVTRFYMGLETIDGELWCNFNFVDTPFHLSMVNAFVVAPRFPPMDLDMAPYPLKYHFLADFFVAHLFRLGLPQIPGVWFMNLLSAATMVGAVWATFERWLKLSARWVLLAGLIFLFLNPALLNLLHYWIFHPDFFNPAAPFDGLFAYPFFNFEAMLTNLLEPQRGFLFTLPIILLILHGLFGDEGAAPEPVGARPPPSRRRFLVEAFVLICLLPLAHIVAFTLLAMVAVPAVWAERDRFFNQWRRWGAAFAVGLLQLVYLFVYVPPPDSAYPSWLTFSLLPTDELAGVPHVVRRIVFWLLADGDFLGWGLFFAATAAFYRPLRRFFGRWKWYFLVCGGCFVAINFISFPFEWGDNNKFVLFLNLGLSFVIVLGAAQWTGRPGAWRSHLLWGFFFALCVVPHAYEYYRDMYDYPYGKILLFEKHGRKAAAWLRLDTRPGDVVLTAADNVIHFVTPLAGRPTLAGIYANTNVYRQEKREEEIRRIYEKGDFGLVHKLGVRYVCISRNERRRYQISGRWTDLMVSGQAVAFHAGDPDDVYSVFLFDAKMLPTH